MNKSHHRVALLSALIALTGGATAYAQYTGPGARKPASLPLARTVAEVLKDPTDDRPVELQGTLVRQTGREEFLFKDATGEITVEIDADDFPQGQAVAADASVRITGEVETRTMRSPTIDVDALSVAPVTATP